MEDRRLQISHLLNYYTANTPPHDLTCRYTTRYIANPRKASIYSILLFIILLCINLLLHLASYVVEVETAFGDGCNAVIIHRNVSS